MNTLCFHVNFKHESTKHAYFHVNIPFSAYFYSRYIIMVKGLLESIADCEAFFNLMATIASCHWSGKGSIT